jgi:hypothetical protein
MNYLTKFNIDSELFERTMSITIFTTYFIDLILKLKPNILK